MCLRKVGRQLECQQTNYWVGNDLSLHPQNMALDQENACKLSNSGVSQQSRDSETSKIFSKVKK